jgi:hypothetical protein
MTAVCRQEAQAVQVPEGGSLLGIGQEDRPLYQKVVQAQDQEAVRSRNDRLDGR